MKKFFFALFLYTYVLCLVSFSQERFGIATSIYSGLGGIWLNPSSSACSPFRYDFNLITFHTYLDNNDFYLYKSNIPGLIANGTKPINAYNVYDINHGIRSDIMAYDRNPSVNVNLFQNFLFQGPSIMLSFEKWSIGLITDVRAGASAIGVLNKVAKIGFENMSYVPLSHQYIYVPDFRVNGTGWAEIGLNVAGVLKQNKSFMIKGGVTLKYLIGISDMYVHNKSTYMYYANDNDMDFYYLNMDYGHSLPTSGSDAGVLGSGQSADIGITIQRFERTRSKTHRSFYYNNSDCPVFCRTNPYLLYKWKLGISLLDLGYMKFDKDAATFSYSDVNAVWLNFAHWAPKKIDGFDNGISSHLENINVAQPVSNHFYTLMPMALSLQYDYYFIREYYLNVSLIQRLPHFNSPGLDRINTIAVTPRWDDVNLGVSLPLILYEYRYPRIGLAFRFFNVFSVGTDKLGAFLNNKVTGLDIYFSIRINGFNPCK